MDLSLSADAVKESNEKFIFFLYPVYIWFDSDSAGGMGKLCFIVFRHPHQTISKQLNITYDLEKKRLSIRREWGS